MQKTSNCFPTSNFTSRLEIEAERSIFYGWDWTWKLYSSSKCEVPDKIESTKKNHITKKLRPSEMVKITSKTEMELKKRILHLWSWKFFFPWSRWSIFACHLKKRWIRRQNNEVLINSGNQNIVHLHGVETEIPATILFILDIGPTETHTNCWSSGQQQKPAASATLARRLRQRESFKGSSL